MKQAALLLVVGFVAIGLTPPRVAAGEAYSGPRSGYRYDFERQQYVRVYVAETLVVPVPIPGTLLINVAPPTAPPPVTISPAALEAERRRTQAAEQAQGDTAARLARIEARLEKLTRPAGSARDLPPRPRVAGEATRPVKTEAAPKAESSPPRPLAQAVGILRLRCAECHTGEKGRGEVSLFNDQGAFELNGTDWDGVWDQVKRDRMPKVPEKLPPEEKAVIKAMTQK